MKGNFFKFYECCRIVQGANRSAIYDLQRGSFYFFPNTFIKILKEYEKRKVSKLFDDFSSQAGILTKYFDFLLENELIFLTDNPENFPPINPDFEKSLYLDFLVMEIDELQKFKIELLNGELDTSGVEHLVIINSSNSIENLENVLKILYDSRIKFITYISHFYPGLLEKVHLIKSKNERLKRVIFYNTPNNFESSPDKNIELIPEDLKKLLTRRVKNMNDFILNEHAYLESLNYNLFFNRRVFIKNNGDIKPSYFHNKKHGNLEQDQLWDIILQPGFRKIWNVNKDQIEVCKDCEFRYMCPDNRIPIENDGVNYHKTLCNYDPYSNNWQIS